MSHQDDNQGTRRFSSRRRVFVIGFVMFFASWLVFSVASSAITTRPRAYLVPTGSMAPTIRAGDRVAVETTPKTPPNRGEIWVFRMPPMAKKGNVEGLKRVIGLPGETIEVASGQVIINGKPLTEPYLGAPISYTIPPITLGPDEYFLLGDNRNTSFDSHNWGPLPSNYLVGPAKARVWPVSRLGPL